MKVIWGIEGGVVTLGMVGAIGGWSSPPLFLCFVVGESFDWIISACVLASRWGCLVAFWTLVWDPSTWIPRSRHKVINRIDDWRSKFVSWIFTVMSVNVNNNYPILSFLKGFDIILIRDARASSYVQIVKTWGFIYRARLTFESCRVEESIITWKPVHLTPFFLIVIPVYLKDIILPIFIGFSWLRHRHPFSLLTSYWGRHHANRDKSV